MGEELSSEKKYGTLDMISMFKGLCVLEKQTIIPKRVLKHLWGMTDKCTKKVLEKFADCNLASLVASGPSKKEEIGLRMHDLVLERCQQLAGNERPEWHKKIVDAYAKDLHVDANDEQSEKSRAWWSAKDDGYIIGHLSKHLVSSGQEGELELLLCDIRWIMHQIKAGGLAPLNSDFEHLFGVEKYTKSGMRRVHKVLNRSFPYKSKQQGDLAFFVFAHLSQLVREEPQVARLLSSIDRHYPKPWLRPANKLLGARDSREEWKAEFSTPDQDIVVDWKKGTILVDDYECISLWSTFHLRSIWSIPHYVIATATSRDGKLIAAVSYDRKIRRWHADSGNEIGKPLVVDLEDLEDNVVHISVSEDGNVIAFPSKGKRIQRWDAHSGAKLKDFPIRDEYYVKCFALCEDRSVIEAGPIEGPIRLLDTLNGTQIGKPLIRIQCGLKKVVLSEDRNTVVTMDENGTILIWDTNSGAQIGDLPSHKYIATSFAMSKDGKVIFVGSYTGKIWQLDVQSRAEIGSPFTGHEGEVTSIAVSQDGKKLISESDDGTIRQWDANLHNGSEELEKCATIGYYSGLTISGSWDGTIPRLNTDSGAKIIDPFSEYSEACIALNEDRNVVVLCSNENTVRRWKAKSEPESESESESEIIDLIENKEWVTCIVVSDDGKTIVTGSMEGTVRQWDSKSGEQIGVPLSGHSDYLNCLAVSEDGKTIVSGAFDGTVRRWNAVSGEQIGDPLIVEEEKVVPCVAVNRNGKIIVSGSSVYLTA